MFFLYFSSSECVSVSMRLCVMQHLNIVFLVSWLEIYMNWTIFLVPFGLATWPFCFYTKFWKKDKKIATDCMCKRWCKWNESLCLLMSETRNGTEWSELAHFRISSQSDNIESPFHFAIYIIMHIFEILFSHYSRITLVYCSAYVHLLTRFSFCVCSFLFFCKRLFNLRATYVCFPFLEKKVLNFFLPSQWY